MKQRLIRFIISAVLFAVALILSGHFFYPALVLFIIAYIIAGYDVVWDALRNIIRGKLFDENFLMSVATIGAFFIEEYAEAVAVMLFYQIGEFFGITFAAHPHIGWFFLCGHSPLFLACV